MNDEEKEKALKIASRYLGLGISSEPPEGLWWSDFFYGPIENYWFVYVPSPSNMLGGARCLIISRATGEVIDEKRLTNSE